MFCVSERVFGSFKEKDKEKNAKKISRFFFLNSCVVMYVEQGTDIPGDPEVFMSDDFLDTIVAHVHGQ